MLGFQLKHSGSTPLQATNIMETVSWQYARRRKYQVVQNPHRYRWRLSAGEYAPSLIGNFGYYQSSWDASLYLVIGCRDTTQELVCKREDGGKYILFKNIRLADPSQEDKLKILNDLKGKCNLAWYRTKCDDCIIMSDEELKTLWNK